MELNLEEMLNKVIDQLESLAKTKTIIGEPFKLGDFECIPVIRIGMGFGSAGVTGNDEKKGSGKGGGAGAGINLEPLGFLVTKGDEISMVTVNRSKGLNSVFEKVPDLLEKIIDSRKKKEKS